MIRISLVDLAKSLPMPMTPIQEVYLVKLLELVRLQTIKECLEPEFQGMIDKNSISVDLIEK